MNGLLPNLVSGLSIDLRVSSDACPLAVMSGFPGWEDHGRIVPIARQFYLALGV